MTNCPDVKDNLYEYIYGELDKDLEIKITEHLKNCSACNNEYTELKKLLVDDMADLRTVANSISIPRDTKEKINLLLKDENKKRNNKHHILFGRTASSRISLTKYAVAACMALIILFTTPAMAYIIQIPTISKYLELDKNIETKFQEGKGQIIGKEDTMKDITFTVDGIIRKKDKTLILFTTKLDKQTDKFNYAMPSLSHGVLTVKDQLGFNYRVGSGGITLKSVNEDGEAKCIFETTALKPWAYKLNMKITAMELGYFDEKDNSAAPNDKKSYGLWDVEFYIKHVKE